jgi:DNA-binding HxlR family transcriptional regulator
MTTSYHQFCPVAKAAELLGDRWTLLVIREMLAGSSHFNELRRGVPTMSPTLLSKRLHQLVHGGLVERRDDGREVAYVLTAAGRDLKPVLESLGAWGVSWIGELGEADLDPKLLLWDLHRNVDRALLPAGRTVVSFRFADVPIKLRSWWLVMTTDAVDVCDFDPGYDVSVTVTGDLRQLVEIWRGDSAWADAIRSGRVQLQGPELLRRAVPVWFPPSRFAGVPRAPAEVQLSHL